MKNRQKKKKNHDWTWAASNLQPSDKIAFIVTSNCVSLRICWMTCWHALWLCSSRWNSTSDLWNKFSDSFIDELQWSSLHTRRSFSSICLTHDSYFCTLLPFADIFSFLLSPESNHLHYQFHPHLLIHNVPLFNISFLWNAIPAHILWLSNRTAFWSALHKFLFSFCQISFCNLSAFYVLQLCLLYIATVCMLSESTFACRL